MSTSNGSGSSQSGRIGKYSGQQEIELQDDPQFGKFMFTIQWSRIMNQYYWTVTQWKEMVTHLNQVLTHWNWISEPMRIVNHDTAELHAYSSQVNHDLSKENRDNTELNRCWTESNHHWVELKRDSAEPNHDWAELADSTAKQRASGFVNRYESEILVSWLRHWLQVAISTFARRFALWNF